MKIVKIVLMVAVMTIVFQAIVIFSLIRELRKEIDIRHVLEENYNKELASNSHIREELTRRYLLIEELEEELLELK